MPERPVSESRAADETILDWHYQLANDAAIYFGKPESTMEFRNNFAAYIARNFPPKPVAESQEADVPRFKVGDRVLCIDCLGFGDLLATGEKYTVKQSSPSMVLLQGKEASWVPAGRFKPVAEQPADEPGPRNRDKKLASKALGIMRAKATATVSVDGCREELEQLFARRESTEITSLKQQLALEDATSHAALRQCLTEKEQLQANLDAAERRIKELDDAFCGLFDTGVDVAKIAVANNERYRTQAARIAALEAELSTKNAWIQFSSTFPDEHVAWVRYKQHSDGRTTIHLCDQDSERAFKVYKRPSSELIKARDRVAALEAELAEARAALSNGEKT